MCKPAKTLKGAELEMHNMDFSLGCDGGLLGDQAFESLKGGEPALKSLEYPLVRTGCFVTSDKFT